MSSISRKSDWPQISLALASSSYFARPAMSLNPCFLIYIAEAGPRSEHRAIFSLDSGEWETDKSECYPGLHLAHCSGVGMTAKWPDKVLSKLFICFYRHLFVHLRKQFVMSNEFCIQELTYICTSSFMIWHMDQTNEQLFKTTWCTWWTKYKWIFYSPLSELVWTRNIVSNVPDRLSLLSLCKLFASLGVGCLGRCLPVPLSSHSTFTEAACS